MILLQKDFTFSQMGIVLFCLPTKSFQSFTTLGLSTPASYPTSKNGPAKIANWITMVPKFCPNSPSSPSRTGPAVQKPGSPQTPSPLEPSFKATKMDLWSSPTVTWSANLLAGFRTVFPCQGESDLSLTQGHESQLFWCVLNDFVLRFFKKNKNMWIQESTYIT